MAAHCKMLMHKTLKTGIITECVVFLRLPNSPEILIRNLHFQEHYGDLIMFAYPEGTKETEHIPMAVNIFILDYNCNIINILAPTTPADLIGINFLTLFPDPAEKAYSQFLIANTFSTSQTNTWFSQIQFPNAPPNYTLIKSTNHNSPHTILTTRHIP